jgi:pyrroline-5-carboxylate reductase
MYTFGFIGAGHMGKALIEPFAKANKDELFYVYDTDPSAQDFTEELNGIFAKSALSLAQKSDIIWLFIRPNTVTEVLSEIGSVLSGKTVVSICAGVSANTIREAAGIPDLEVVLVMPNTPALLGLGASAYSVDKETDEDKLSDIVSLLDCCGISRRIPPDKMREIIAINGSSPAYIYTFAKAFIDYGTANGIDPSSAKALFIQTLMGSAAMLSNSDTPLETLITQVATKGGTTRAGLDVLDKADFTGIIRQACTACTSRAYELGQQ